LKKKGKVYKQVEVLFAKMNIKVLEEKKNNIILAVDGVGHGFCNVLVKELWNDKNIKSAGYHIEHPLIGKAKIVVESKADVRNALNEAVKRIKKSADTFKKSFVKIC
jgi:DNA-directed RNA polymerase subunit L